MSFTANPAASQPAGHETTGAATFGPLGDARRDTTVDGFALDSSKKSGSVTLTSTVSNDHPSRWYRFSFRGLPQANFAVTQDDLLFQEFRNGFHLKFSARSPAVSADAPRPAQRRTATR